MLASPARGATSWLMGPAASVCRHAPLLVGVVASRAAAGATLVALAVLAGAHRLLRRRPRLVPVQDLMVGCDVHRTCARPSHSALRGAIACSVDGAARCEARLTRWCSLSRQSQLAASTMRLAGRAAGGCSRQRRAALFTLASDWPSGANGVSPTRQERVLVTARQICRAGPPSPGLAWPGRSHRGSATLKT